MTWLFPGKIPSSSDSVDRRDADYRIACANGSVGLHLALAALGGDAHAEQIEFIVDSTKAARQA